MEVVWTETAIETFLKVVDYLFENWSISEIENFEKKVDELIERVANYNQICPQSKLLGYRKCVVDKQNSLIYHIINNKLLLVTFIDNRSQNNF